MKVAQLITSLSIGGAEKLVVDSVPLYQKQGLEVDVITLSNKHTKFTDKLKKETTGEIIGLTSGSVYNPLLIFKLMKLINRYDVIHAHLFPVLYWVVLAKWLSFSSVKIIYTEHNTHNKRRDHFLLKRIDKLIYKGLSNIVTISDEVDIKLKKHLNNNLKFTLIPNGVDIEKFIDAKSLNKEDFFSKEDFFIIQVSSFREQKDQPTLIRAMKLLPENFKLLLVGDGYLRKNNEELVKELNLENKIKFLGLRNDISNLLKMSDVSVLSSFHEGLSLSSIEGMSLSPFVASDVPGLTEVVKNAGILFKQGDYQQLADILLKLKEDKSYYLEVKAKCYSRALEFDINKMIESYLNLFNEKNYNHK